MEKETKLHSVKRRTLVVILVTAMIILAAAVIGLLVLSLIHIFKTAGSPVLQKETDYK